MARVTAEEKASENEDEQDEEAIAPEATERPTRQATAEAAGTGPNENTRVPPAAPAKAGGTTTLSRVADEGPKPR